MWLSVHFRKIQSIFVTVYCMNFIIISCHTYRLFSLTFVPLPLAPNSGDATAKKPRVKLRRMSVVCAGSSTADDPINHTIVTVSKSTDSRTEYTAIKRLLPIAAITSVDLPSDLLQCRLLSCCYVDVGLMNFHQRSLC